MTPKYFEFSYQVPPTKYPFAWGIYAPSIHESHPGCGHQITRYQGEAEARIEGGDSWPDIVLSGSGTPTPAFMLSERVIDSLQKAGVNSFQEYPVRITEVESAKLRLPPPQYYYIQVSGTILIDWEASGLPPMSDICPICYRKKGRWFEGDRHIVPSRMAPLVDSWDGSDLFRVLNYHRNAVYCTMKVLLLARKQRWTNFCFEPMDVVTRYSYGRGIDYLSKRWPPKKWYPDPPYAGKTWQEWLEQLKNGDSDQRYYARKALICLMEEGFTEPVFLLVQLFEEGNPEQRRDAGSILRNTEIHYVLKKKGVKLPKGLLKKIEKFLEE